MNKKLMINFKKLLTQKKASITNKLNSKKIDEVEIETGGDEIDTATQSTEREMQFELSGIDKRMMQDIDNALAKIEKGTFGSCECCGKEIPQARLDALPWVRYCKECQEEAEKNSK
jgi:DnaK suppressor protein